MKDPSASAREVGAGHAARAATQPDPPRSPAVATAVRASVRRRRLRRRQPRPARRSEHTRKRSPAAGLTRARRLAATGQRGNRRLPHDESDPARPRSARTPATADGEPHAPRRHDDHAAREEEGGDRRRPHRARLRERAPGDRARRGRERDPRRSGPLGAVVAALLSILLRKGLIADWEFVEELRKI